MRNKDIRLVDIINLLGGRTRINIFLEHRDAIELNMPDADWKPIFNGCIDEDFKFKSKPTWTSDNKKMREFRDKFSDYHINIMNIYDNSTDQTLNIWITKYPEYLSENEKYIP